MQTAIKILAWMLPISLAVSAIAYSSSNYYQEEVRQDAFMMKVCTDAGGSWYRDWRNKPQCDRPKQESRSQ